MKFRIEKDTFGPIEVAADSLWGAQTARSLKFFSISSEKIRHVTDFYVSVYMMENTTYKATEKDLIKFLTMGWYVYSLFRK